MALRIVDASIVTAAVLPGQLDLRVELIFRHEAPDLVAPELLSYEVTNSVHRQVRRGLMSRGDAVLALDAFWEMEIRLVNEPRWTARAFELAQEFQQRVIYDAIYLACGQSVGADVWTRDRRFVTSFGSQRPPFLRLFPDDLHLLE